jgi:hypothetical protein
MESGYHQVPLTLHEKQFRRLKNGHAVQLKHHQIAHGNKHAHHVVVHTTKAKKIHSAARNQKGVRLDLTKHELEMSGQGLKEFWAGLKKAGSWIKDNIINTPVYQQTLKPIVHGLVDQGINAVSTMAGSKAGPTGQQLTSQLGNAAANKLYESTGLGMKKHGKGFAMKGGYRPFTYGHGSSQTDVDMSSREIKNTWPASEFTPLLAPSKMPSLIQHAEQARGTGVRGKKKKGRYGGSFRMN